MLNSKLGCSMAKFNPNLRPPRSSCCRFTPAQKFQHPFRGFNYITNSNNALIVELFDPLNMGNFMIPVISAGIQSAVTHFFKIANRDKLETHFQINFANCEVDTCVIYLFDVYSAYIIYAVFTKPTFPLKQSKHNI